MAIPVAALVLLLLAPSGNSATYQPALRLLRVDWDETPGGSADPTGSVKVRLKSSRGTPPLEFDPELDSLLLSVGGTVLFDSTAPAEGAEIRRNGTGLRVILEDRDGGASFTLRLLRRRNGVVSLSFRGRRLALDGLAASDEGGASVSLRLGEEILGGSATWIRKGSRRWAYRSEPPEVHDLDRFENAPGKPSGIGVVIRSRAEWVGYELGGGLWTSGTVSEPPIAAFGEMAVVVDAVFPSTGYGLRIDEIVEESDRIVVRFTEERPGKDCAVVWMFTTGHDHRVVPYSTKPVTFLGRLEYRDCR